MSRSLNKAMLIGNLGSDPEIRTTGNGSRVAQFSLATSRRWNDRNGQQQEKTEWHRIVAWDKPFNLVDVIEKYVKKGDKLYVEGEIEYRSYEDKDGVTKYTTEIRAREILMLGGKDGGGGGGDFDRGRSSSGGRATAGAATGGKGGYDDFDAGSPEDDDDLPF